VKVWEIDRGELGFRDVELRRPRPDETEVDVRYAGICGSDLPKLLHLNNFALPASWRPGHEIVGTDADGGWVVCDPLVPCQHCSYCVSGDTHLCPNLGRLGWDLPGGFAERVILPTANVHPLPGDLDPSFAVLADPAAVAVHGLRCNSVGEPARVAVVGAGTVGLLTAIYAQEQGWTVTVVHRDSRPPPEAVAAALPASFRSSGSLTSTETFDLVVDAATGGNAAPLELAVRLTRAGGTILVQNAYHPGVILRTPLRDVFRRSLRLLGSFSYCRRRQPDDFRQALALLARNPGQICHMIAVIGNLPDLQGVLTDERSIGVRRVLAVDTRRT